MAVLHHSSAPRSAAQPLDKPAIRPSSGPQKRDRVFPDSSGPAQDAEAALPVSAAPWLWQRCSRKDVPPASLRAEHVAPADSASTVPQRNRVPSVWNTPDGLPRRELPL